jgi:hypothetical protein
MAKYPVVLIPTHKFKLNQIEIPYVEGTGSQIVWWPDE